MGKYLLAGIFGAIFGAYICALVISESLSSDRSPAHQKGEQTEGQQSQSHPPIAANVTQAGAPDDGGSNSDQEPNAPDRVLNWMGRFLVDIKITDVLLVIFTYVLAEKTGGLFTETAGMRTAAEGQSKDMQDSIREAGRSASAMEGVAVSMAANVAFIEQTVATNREIADRQKQLGELQSRAFVAATFGAVVPQNAQTGLKYEVRMVLVNQGNTPARDVRFSTAADVLPFPLPLDFDFPLPAQNQSTSFIAPRLTKILTGVVPRLYEPDELSAAQPVKKRIYCWGAVAYSDVFGIERFTRFCISVLPLENSTWMSYDTDRHNDAD